MNQCVFRFIIHPLTLSAVTLLVILMILITGQVHLDSFLFHLSATDFEGDMTLEEDVALILVAFGVFLEERALLTKRVYPQGVPHFEEERDETSEVLGACMLMIGLLMEACDQCFEPFLFKVGLGHFGLGSMVVLDVLALLVCVYYPVKLFKIKNHESA